MLATATLSFCGSDEETGGEGGAGCRSEGDDDGAGDGAGPREVGACTAQPLININKDVAPAKAGAPLFFIF